MPEILTPAAVHERGQGASDVLSYALSTNVDGTTEVYVQSARLRLTDAPLLRTLMDRAPDGPLTIRDLALRAGLSKSKVHYLLNGERPLAPLEKAHLIALAVGTHAGAFFSADLSTSTDRDSRTPKESDGHERTLDADAAGRSRQLGQDA